jgi:flavin-dependent dehydrogenase
MSKTYDAIVVGGGPAGATAALTLARQGLSAVVLDRLTFPHFHIGESFLPRNLALIRELGLEAELAALPQVEKRGGTLVSGHGRDEIGFWFDNGLAPGETIAFNIERAPFDRMLLDAAKAAGVEVREATPVKEILRLADGDVAVRVEGQAGEEEVRGCWLIDASGQGAVVGRHLGTREVLPDLRKVAYYGHFEGVWRAEMPEGGFPIIVMCQEGWFWLIPLDEKRTSIGVVLSADFARSTGVPPDRLLSWAIARCPVVRERTAGAVTPERTFVTADFSYRCDPYAGPGYFLVGDAATFVDPIFSTGVCMGMMSGAEAARRVADLLTGRATNVARIRRNYRRFVKDSSESFFRLVRLYYDHSFRELFLDGTGPLNVHRAVISILAGHVFPRPIFALRWRLLLFHLLVVLNRRFRLGTPREPFSLLAEDAGEEAAPARLRHAGS